VAEPLGSDTDLFTDARVTLSLTPDSDLSSATGIRCYLTDQGNRVQFGSEKAGVSAGTEVSVTDRPNSLTLNGSSISEGQYVVQWVYEDAGQNEHTIAERRIDLVTPSDA
jgi:hypothetical protein